MHIYIYIYIYTSVVILALLLGLVFCIFLHSSCSFHSIMAPKKRRNSSAVRVPAPKRVRVSSKVRRTLPPNVPPVLDTPAGPHPITDYPFRNLALVPVEVDGSVTEESPVRRRLQRRDSREQVSRLVRTKFVPIFGESIVEGRLNKDGQTIIDLMLPLFRS